MGPVSRTHYTGKWDAGMATPEHTPFGRGFETSFLYFQHANDYWNKKTGIQAGCHLCRHGEMSGRQGHISLSPKEVKCLLAVPSLVP